MSTSDQQGDRPLTRKQLREIRLTGATPVITEDEAAAAAAAPPSAAASLPTSATPTESAPAPRSDAEGDPDDTPLTRRQVREQERIRTASVPVVNFDDESAEDETPQDETAEDETPEDETAEDEAPEDEIVVDAAPEAEIVSGIPEFAPATPADELTDVADEFTDVTDDDLDDDVVDVEPVSAATASQSTGEVLVDSGEAAESPDADDVDADDAGDDDADAEINALGITGEDHAEDDAPEDEDPITTGERPVVNSMFGKGLLDEQADVPAFTPSFDELITSDSGGSQHLAPNTLIFTPSPGGGSLSGPVASTGELLITGSYDLPRGIGSQGHAQGAADGKEADAVLIDGELPPSSSPTPIAASSAISTTKPAGEVIRPPAPEKGNKLMLTLAIMAGGLALALAVVLIVAFTTNVL